MNPVLKVIRSVDTAFSKVETAAISIVAVAMIVLMTAHIFLKLTGRGVIQLEEAARYLVIWVGFLGGSVAAYQSRHINIDIMTRFLKGVPKRIILCSVWLIGVTITLVLARTAISFVGDLKEAAGVAIAFGDPGSEFQIPEWLPAIILPIGLILIAWHMFAGAVYAAVGIPGPGHDEPSASTKSAAEQAPAETESAGSADAAQGTGGAA